MTAGTDKYLAYYCEREFERQVTDASEDAYLQALRLTPKDRVLDIGCSGGHTLFAIALRFSAGELVGIDPDPRPLRIAKEKAQALGLSERVQWFSGSAMELPFEDGSFSVVLANRVLMHLPVKRALLEIDRVLRPGGRLLISCTPREYYLRKAGEELRALRLPLFSLYAVLNGMRLEWSGRQWGYRGKHSNYQSLFTLQKLLGSRGYHFRVVRHALHPVLKREDLILLGTKA